MDSTSRPVPKYCTQCKRASGPKHAGRWCGPDWAGFRRVVLRFRPEAILPVSGQRVMSCNGCITLLDEVNSEAHSCTPSHYAMQTPAYPKLTESVNHPLLRGIVSVGGGGAAGAKRRLRLRDGPRPSTGSTSSWAVTMRLTTYHRCWTEAVSATRTTSK
jgi:hypothetical protein